MDMDLKEDEEYPTYCMEMICSNCGGKFTQKHIKGQSCKGIFICEICGMPSARASHLYER
jgi:hypothetical protein